jgi:hypothetical protein
MDLADCPPWEYGDHPQRAEVLASEVAQVLIEMRTFSLPTLAFAGDSRGIHERMFRRLAPPACPYYAGHFRGENFLCLFLCQAFIPGDNRVGAHPAAVQNLMSFYVSRVEYGLTILDARRGVGSSNFALEVVRFACGLQDMLFRIHPYVNGNGHMGRLTVWAVLGRYGFWPENWPVEPRPPDPPYTDLIRRYRDGDTEPLERYVLESIS